MTMFSNIDVLPMPTYAVEPKAIEHTLIEIYPGSFRIADGKSISIVANERLQSPELPDLNLYNKLYGDRSLVIEGSLDGWKKHGEVNHSVTTTSGVKDIGIVVDLTQHYVDPLLNKWVSEVEYYGKLNDLGKYLSKAETLRQAYLNLKQTSEYHKFVKFLKSKGYEEPAELEQIAVGFIGKALAAVSADGKVLYANKEFEKILNEYAEHYDVDPEVLREYALAFHEQTHRFGVRGGASGESRLEALISEFFEGLAKGEFASPDIAVSRSLSSKHQKYIDIIKVAATRYGDVSKNYGTFLSAVFQEYFSAAIEDGMDEEEARDYALKKTAEEAEKMTDKEENEEQEEDENYECNDEDSEAEPEEGEEQDSEENEEQESD